MYDFSQSSSPDRQGQDSFFHPEKNAIKLYLQEIGKIPLLTQIQEVELARRIRNGDSEAHAIMVRSNLRLVVKIAHDYANFGLPISDLISEGNIGLMKAVDRFDPDRGGKLSTYAAWWIKQSIKRALANQSKTIRLPVHMVDKISRMRRTATALAEQLGREPSDEELAAEMGFTTSKIAHIRSVSVRPTSLDAPIGDDEGSCFGEMVGDESETTPFEKLQDKALKRELVSMLDQIEPREAEIIRLRYGLDGGAERTLEEVGVIFNITRERVRQLQNLALNKMRRIFRDKEQQRSHDEILQERTEKGKQDVLREYIHNNSKQRHKTV
ncbi:MAG: RNA polymerase sigma factor RpoD/SigA [Opitutales bacterium]|nr:RNA polymerase sigma factor RpoD/SigA [Opitutales bacterium]